MDWVGIVSVDQVESHGRLRWYGDVKRKDKSHYRYQYAGNYRLRGQRVRREVEKHRTSV